MPFFTVGESVLEVVHWQGLSKGYESNYNRLRIGERVEWIVCHSDRQYLLIIASKFLSESDEYSYHYLPPKKSECTILANLPVFEIVFAASNVSYHHYFSALSCIATPMLYCNLCCIYEILSLVCISVKR